MLAKYAEAELRFLELELMLGDPAVVNDDDNYQQVLSEWRQLRPLFDLYQQYQAIQTEIEDVQELAKSDDSDICEIAYEEIEILNARIAELAFDMRVLLLPTDPYDDKHAFVELHLSSYDDRFGNDILQMLSRYCDSNPSWTLEMNIDSTEKYIVMILVEGEKAYHNLKSENGTHQVIGQDGAKIDFEVKVYAKADMELDNDDIQTEVFRIRSFGSMRWFEGGVRMIYKPTGIVVSVSDMCSSLQNRIRAKQILQAKLYNRYHEQESPIKDRQIVRRYDFKNDVVIDYRIPEIVFDLSEVQEYGVGQIIEQVIKQEYEARFEKHGL